MLQASDLKPLVGRGRFRCSHCGSRVLNEKEAMEACSRGSAVFPADVATVDYVARRLELAGDAGRARVIRRWSAQHFEEQEAQPAPE